MVTLSSIALMVVVLGVVALALGVGAIAVAAWLRRR